MDFHILLNNYIRDHTYMHYKKFDIYRRQNSVGKSQKTVGIEQKTYTDEHVVP
jgi:hypothetical protein